MADFASRRPVEPDKPAWLHDIDNRPKHPALDFGQLFRRYWGFLLGFGLAMGFEALGFETRASWPVGRDWVVPATTFFWGAGGMCAGILISRKQWVAASPGITLLCIGLTFTVLNIIRHAYVSGPDFLLTTLDILAVVSYSFMLTAFILGVIWMEVTKPLKVAAPEM